MRKQHHDAAPQCSAPAPAHGLTASLTLSFGERKGEQLSQEQEDRSEMFLVMGKAEVAESTDQFSMVERREQ